MSLEETAKLAKRSALGSLITAIAAAISALFRRKAPLPSPASQRVSKTTYEQRLEMAKIIIIYEARMKDGKLAVYHLPSWDGGGTFEVAGINDRYHPAMAHRLRALIEAGKHDLAMREASDYLIKYTDAVKDWSVIPAIEFFLRDCSFNRGPTGAARILQFALDSNIDGIVGPETLRALTVAERNLSTLIVNLRRGREKYERSKYVGRDESSPPWNGLVNRWNKAAIDALRFLPGGSRSPQWRDAASP